MDEGDAAHATIGISRDASISAMKNAVDAFEQVQERVGELHRTLMTKKRRRNVFSLKTPISSLPPDGKDGRNFRHRRVVPVGHAGPSKSRKGEASTMPGKDGLGLNDGQRRAPAAPTRDSQTHTRRSTGVNLGHLLVER
jgi:hypothetical protein